MRNVSQALSSVQVHIPIVNYEAGSVRCIVLKIISKPWPAFVFIRRSVIFLSRLVLIIMQLEAIGLNVTQEFLHQLVSTARVHCLGISIGGIVKLHELLRAV